MPLQFISPGTVCFRISKNGEIIILMTPFQFLHKFVGVIINFLSKVYAVVVHVDQVLHA